ncbi:MAG: rhodanese-like domain-containing protein [Bacillota bacterium]
MFKTNGEKALLSICLVTMIFVGIALVNGTGKEVKAQDSPLEPAVFWYFERMPDDQYRINADELKVLLDAQKDIFILDIRNAEDYDKEHIPGAVNIPFVEVGNRMNEIPKNKPVVLYCYTGQNGGQVTALLNISGYYTRSLSSGWGGWLKELASTAAVVPAGGNASSANTVTQPIPEETVKCPTEQ